MANSPSKLVTLSPEQMEALRQASEKSHIPANEIIRMGLLKQLQEMGHEPQGGRVKHGGDRRKKKADS